MQTLPNTILQSEFIVYLTSIRSVYGSIQCTLLVYLTSNPFPFKGGPIPGCQVVDITQRGQSHYEQTARLTVRLSSGLLTSYFLKVLKDDTGMATCRGE